jgi:hypothetical protein
VTTLLPWRRSVAPGSVVVPDQGRATRLGMRGRPIGRAGWMIYFAITIAGVCGFVGLLVASYSIPQWAAALRIMALVWFASLGVVRFALFWRR